MIIVNTLNEEFYQDVMYEFGKNNYTKLRKIIRTESNGSPGKGHNSVLKIFYKDYWYDNLIMLDGDDFLFPNAIQRINNVRITENSDVISLYGNTKILINNSNYHKLKNETHSSTYVYDLHFKYNVDECKNIHRLNEEYNTTLATPGRLLCINRKLLSKYIQLYDERMYIYDDFMMTVLLYKEDTNPQFNITHLSDSYIYLYNAANEDSVSYQYTDETIYDKNDNKYKRDLIQTHLDKYNITDTSIKPYSTIVNDTINIQEMHTFHKQMILKLHNTLPLTLPRKRILFIDYSEWDYNTINKRALGGTETAFYSLSNVLSKKYNVSVMTLTNMHEVIHQNLQYYPLNINLITKIYPDIIIFQGQCPVHKDILTKINPNIQLWNAMHHNTDVAYITNEIIQYPFDKYIFVSNWQKNRFIQQYKLDHNKCITVPKGISPLINLNELKFIEKDKTMIYYSTPFRGLIVAYQLFQLVKKSIPDIKLKVFSCFSREVEKNKTEYLPITDVNEVNHTEMDIYYRSIYQSLIDDPNIDFYGSVPQKILFEHIKSSMILFYPNTYAETCCTSILEAMAYRCNVISSELGAIPETSNGFANLYNPHVDVLHEKMVTDEIVKNPIQLEQIPESYIRQFVTNTVELINNYHSEYNQKLLTNQQVYIENCTWEKRAKIIEKHIPSV
jgi:glycosyltransferase involved in cell wall biosynthesis